jgi:hypothetical protein
MTQQSLDEVLLSYSADLEQASEALRSIVHKLRDLPQTPDVDSQAMHHPFRACKKFFVKLKKLEHLLDEAKLLILEKQFNVYWTHKLRRRYDLSSNEKKKEVAKEINVDLRHYEHAIRHPESGAACMVLAVGSPDGIGRYVLSDRLTKKRSHTSSSLLDLFPIRLVPLPRRKESFVDSDEKSVMDQT